MTRAHFTLTPVMPVQRRESENALQAKASSTRWDQGMLRHVYVAHDERNAKRATADATRETIPRG